MVSACIVPFNPMPIGPHKSCCLVCLMFITWLLLILTHVGYNTSLVQIDQCNIHIVPYVCRSQHCSSAADSPQSACTGIPAVLCCIADCFALSETWRAPAAVLIREVSPPELGATGSALHLCIRNLVGGCGPLSMALVTSEYVLAILMYILSVLQLSCLKSIKHSSIRAECPAQEQMIRAKANLSSDSVLVVQTDSSEFQVTGIVNTRLSL